jgi:hypothetical protein
MTNAFLDLRPALSITSIVIRRQDGAHQVLSVQETRDMTALVVHKGDGGGKRKGTLRWDRDHDL